MTIKGKLELVYEFHGNGPAKSVIQAFHNKTHKKGELEFGSNALNLVMDQDTIIHEFEEILDTTSKDINQIALKLVNKLAELMDDEFIEITNKYFPEEEVIAKLV